MNIQDSHFLIIVNVRMSTLSGILLLLVLQGGNVSSIDGGWSAWTSWTVCSVRCGRGTRNRFRLCNNPTPSTDGRPCLGKDIQRQPCHKQCPVDGGWSRWKIIQRCTSVTEEPCSLGRETAIRHCDNPRPAQGGRQCVGDPSRVLDCWDERGCPTGLVKPLDFYTQSFVNMTVFVKWREAPYGLLATNFAVYYLQSGNPEYAARHVQVRREAPGPNAPPSGRRYSLLVDVSGIRGSVHVWAEAFRLTATQSMRTPTERHTIMVGENDGGWGPWERWSPCSVTCNIGIEWRRRRCDSPAPSSGGRPCPGSATDRKLCDSNEFC